MDLSLIRQWLFAMSNSNIKDANLAQKKLQQVDKELWGKIISLNTPWGEFLKNDERDR